jgi:hypothetical protein
MQINAETNNIQKTYFFGILGKPLLLSSTVILGVLFIYLLIYLLTYVHMTRSY